MGTKSQPDINLSVQKIEWSERKVTGQSSKNASVGHHGAQVEPIYNEDEEIVT